jgi:uncharacterized protein
MIKTEERCLVTKLRIRSTEKNKFTEWQAKFNATIAAFPGFISLEFLSSAQFEWTIVERFHDQETMSKWRQSKEHQELLSEVKDLLDGVGSLQEEEKNSDNLKGGGVTEVFVTQISHEKEDVFREWLAKIHQIEGKFQGFQGMYIQSPVERKGRNWITLLQFDTIENLDRWLFSTEREELLQESKAFIVALENHRVISPYAGWFSSIAQGGEVPAVWKQTMIVLLVLFPIVMFELKYLSPLLVGLNSSIATFIGNAISVTLIAWPMMPIAIYFLSWWLSPPEDKRKRNTILGTIVVTFLFLIEIALLWNFL